LSVGTILPVRNLPEKTRPSDGLSPSNQEAANFAGVVAIADRVPEKKLHDAGLTGTAVLLYFYVGASHFEEICCAPHVSYPSQTFAIGGRVAGREGALTRQPVQSAWRIGRRASGHAPVDEAVRVLISRAQASLSYHSARIPTEAFIS